MDKYYERFIVTLNTFISDLNRYYPNPGCENFLSVFERLQMGKVILKYLNVMRPNKVALKAKDDSLFENDLIILPEINMHTIWPNLTQAQKNKTWTNLNILFILSELLMTNAEKENKESEDKNKDDKDDKDEESETKSRKIGFNPYLGIMPETPNPECTVDSLFSGPEKLPGDDEEKDDGMLGGLGSMFNMKKWADELKNMTPESINNATKNLQDMMGDADENSKETVSCLLDNIKQHLIDNDISQGNPIKNMKEIANKVSVDMKNKLASGEFNMADMLVSTKELTKNFTAKLEGSDNPLKHPLSMFAGIFDKLDNPNVSTDDKIAQMNSTMKRMGLGNMMNNLENFNMDDPEQMAKMQKKVFKQVNKRR